MCSVTAGGCASTPPAVAAVKAVMTTETKSKILFTTLILAAMAPSCYLLSTDTYLLYGVFLLMAGVAMLAWLWKPWQRN
jgi:hypothetical protein